MANTSPPGWITRTSQGSCAQGQWTVISAGAEISTMPGTSVTHLAAAMAGAGLMLGVLLLWAGRAPVAEDDDIGGWDA